MDTADAFRRMISWMDVTTDSLARSSPTTDTAPDTRMMTGFSMAGSTQLRSTPRVSIRPSAYCRIGLMVSPGRFKAVCWALEVAVVDG